MPTHAYLAVYVWHQSQVLQVRVEQRWADEADTKQRFHDVANSAVVWEVDALGCLHESAAGGHKMTQSAEREIMEAIR